MEGTKAPSRGGRAVPRDEQNLWQASSAQLYSPPNDATSPSFSTTTSSPSWGVTRSPIGVGAHYYRPTNHFHTPGHRA